MKILTIPLLSCFAAYSQNVAVLTYEFADPKAILGGCPKDWPYSIKRIGEAAELPKELSAPWKVVSETDLKAYMEANAAAKEAFNNREPEDITTRKQLIADIVQDLRTIRQSSGTLSAAQMSNALRRIATALLILIEEGKVSLSP